MSPDRRSRFCAAFPDVEPRRLVAAAVRLGEVAAAAGFRGADPYDGLLAAWPAALAGGRRRRQVLMQLHARAPVDLRRLYRHQHAVIPKALGIFASVGVRAADLSGASDPPAFVTQALDVLCADRSAGPRAWGYHWDMQTRWSFYPAGSPNVVATSYAVSGLVEAGRRLGDRGYLDRARAAAEWVADELWVPEGGYFAYHPGRPAPAQIFNASLLGAWAVHVAAGDDAAARRRVAAAVDRVLDVQRSDGSWGYGDGASLQWADSFHTGYVLCCLDRLRDVDPRIGEALARGAEFYTRFFDAGGRAQLWAHKPYPEDGHSAGTGLTTLAVLARRGLIERALLDRVVARVLSAGLRGGHVVHRRYRVGRATVRYLRWCDAHVALGLTDAAALLAGVDDRAPRPEAARPAGGTGAVAAR